MQCSKKRERREEYGELEEETENFFCAVSKVIKINEALSDASSSS